MSWFVGSTWSDVMKLVYWHHDIYEHNEEKCNHHAPSKLYTAGLHYLTIALRGLSFLSHLPCLLTGWRACLKDVSYQALAQCCAGIAICFSYCNYGTHTDHAVCEQEANPGMQDAESTAREYEVFEISKAPPKTNIHMLMHMCALVYSIIKSCHM